MRSRVTTSGTPSENNEDARSLRLVVGPASLLVTRSDKSVQTRSTQQRPSRQQQYEPSYSEAISPTARRPIVPTPRRNVAGVVHLVIIRKPNRHITFYGRGGFIHEIHRKRCGCVDHSLFCG